MKRALPLLFLCACTAPEARAPIPRITGTPAPDEVRINTTVRLQTMDGVGANAYAFPVADDLGWRWEQARWALDGLAYVRVAPWFPHWELQDDAFGVSKDITRTHDLPFAEYLAKRGVEVSLGVWDLPGWMADGEPRMLRAGMGGELGESIASYVAYMAAWGVKLPVVEVQNEPDITARVKYPSPEALRDAALEILDALDAMGLTQVQLHGPNLHAPGDTVAWARVWFESERLAARTAAVSYHAWWSDRPEDFEAIRAFAESVGKPVWATEVGYCPLEAGCYEADGALVEHPDGGSPTWKKPTRHFRPDTWATAWDTSGAYHRAIAWSGASRVYHWSALGHGAWVAKDGAPLASYRVVEHFLRAIPPGARLIESAAGNPEVRTLAFLRPDGSRSVILLNGGADAERVRITSVVAEDGEVTEVWVTDGEGHREAVFEGDALVLPPMSVVSLVLR
ncbi:MAG: hypothetical protein KC933_16550 [Myxococcales bacterium]|nr:hypothetical protein [Myxococcales bacterium]